MFQNYIFFRFHHNEITHVFVLSKKTNKNVYTCVRDINSNIFILKRIFLYAKIFFGLYTPFINKCNVPAYKVL